MMNFFDVDIPDGYEFSVTRNRLGDPPGTYRIKLSEYDRHGIRDKSLLMTFEFVNNVASAQAILQIAVDELVRSLAIAKPPDHVCGMAGFNGMLGDVCHACSG